MSANRNNPDELPEAPDTVDEPVVTDAPSSHQPRVAPPPGSEPQGRITTIAVVVTIVVIAILLAVVLLY